MSRFLPPAAVGRKKAEWHYANVHHPFARRMFRDHGEILTRYVANRADLQYSLRGHFEEDPTLWRFVITEVDDDMANASAYIPDWFQPLIWEDHKKCIERVEAWEVDEHVIVDRRCGQITMAKFMFLYDSIDPKVVEGRMATYSRDHVPALAELFRSAYGGRMYVSNVVRRQAETTDDFGEGAAYTGGYAAFAPVMAIAEFYFDNAEWADEFFSSRPVVALMRDSSLGRIAGFSITETVGVDKREG